MPTLTVSHLTVHFERAARPAVEDVSFTLEAGQIAMIIGPNGSGKTTLFRAILGFIAATGSVQVCDRPVKEAYPLIGYVPQHLRFDPTLPMTGRELLRMPLQCLPRQQRQPAFDWALETFHLQPFLDQPVGTFSGGQFKLLLIARAMMQHPRVLLLDEPEAGVDVGGEQRLYQLLERLVHEQQLTALIISHELNIVLEVADQVLCLNRRLFGMGPPIKTLTPETIAQLYGPAMALYRHHHPHGEGPTC
jgi:ABC-type Mn2+/Zn2+ transport system ATPase subunit